MLLFCILLLIVGILVVCSIQHQNNKEDIVQIKKESPEVIEKTEQLKEEQKGEEEERPLPADVVTEYKGFQVLGSIRIPNLSLDSYILAETNDKSLKTSVTKLCGPLLNTQGNFCIAGHNYMNKNMFGKLHLLKVGDTIYISDIYERTVEYKIYRIDVTTPKDVSCLSYDNSGNTEITLITCTATATKRLIIKAIAIYD